MNLNQWPGTAIAAFVLVGAFLTRALAGPEPVWQIEANPAIEAVVCTPSDVIIAASKDSLLGIDVKSGSVVWSVSNLPGDDWSYLALIPGNPFAAVVRTTVYWPERAEQQTVGRQVKRYDSYFAILDYESGQVKWDMHAVGLESWLGHFLLPKIDLLLVAGRDSSRQYSMSAVKMADGQVLWTSDSFFGEKDPEMLFLHNGTPTLMGYPPLLFDSTQQMVSFMDKKSLRKWDYLTGEIVWETPIQAGSVPALGSRYAPMQLDENEETIYVPFDKTMCAVRARDGALLWDANPKFRGRVHQMQGTAHGLLVKGGHDMEGKSGNPFVTLLNPQTGQEIWEKPYKKLSSNPNVAVTDTQVVVYKDKKMYAIDLGSGGYEEITKDLKFEGGEYPRSLTHRTDGYLLVSDQNLMLVDETGHQIFHTYRKAPGMSVVEKIGQVMLSVAINFTMAATSYYGRSYSPGTFAPYYDPYPITAFPVLSYRYKATTRTPEYIYMLTDVKRPDEEGPGLVKVALQDGREINSVVLGDRMPTYCIDDTQTRLFFLEKEKVHPSRASQEIAAPKASLVCYEF